MSVNTIVRAGLVAAVLAANAVGLSATPTTDVTLFARPGCPSGCRPATITWWGDAQPLRTSADS